VRYWRDVQDYHHGILILATTIVWLVKLAPTLDAEPLRPRPIATLPLLMALTAWVIAWRANGDLAHQLLFPVILGLIVCASAGTRVVRSVALPLACLVFAIPVWDFVTPALQWLTVHVTHLLLGIAGVPVIVEESTITLPGGVFAVVEGCSGKRYLVISLAVACFAGAGMRLSGRRRLVLIGLSALAALVANWLRVITIVMAGYLTHMQHYLVRVEHRSFGYVLFAGLVAVVIWLASRLAESVSPRSAVRNASRVEEAPVQAIPRAAWPPLILLLLPVGAELASSPSDGVSVPRIASLPVLTNAWQGPLPPSSSWQPQFHGAAAELRAAYSSAQGDVEIYLNVYGYQQPGRELVQGSNSIVAPMRAIPFARTATTADALRAGKAHPAMRRATDVTGEQWIIAFTHTVGGRLTTTPAQAQFWLGVQSLLGGAPSGTLAIAARCNGNCEQAEQRAIDFWTRESSTLLSLIATDWSRWPRVASQD
jgi:EpsI family protein